MAQGTAPPQVATQKPHQRVQQLQALLAQVHQSSGALCASCPPGSAASDDTSTTGQPVCCGSQSAAACPDLAAASKRGAGATGAKHVATAILAATTVRCAATVCGRATVWPSLGSTRPQQFVQLQAVPQAQGTFTAIIDLQDLALKSRSGNFAAKRAGIEIDVRERVNKLFAAIAPHVLATDIDEGLKDMSESAVAACIDTLLSMCAVVELRGAVADASRAAADDYLHSTASILPSAARPTA